MKHSVYYLFALLLLTACKPTVPKEYIQPGDMEDILYDYHVAMGMLEPQFSTSSSDESNLIKNRTYKLGVLKKHGVTEKEFNESLEYYVRHADRLHTIYENIADRLSDELMAQGASINDINQYGALTERGDTANIWPERKSVVLSPHPPYNSLTFHIDTDSAFHKGDRLILSFESQYIVQEGSRDAVVEIAMTLGNDSVVSQTSHIMGNTHNSIQIADEKKLGIKNVRGYIMLNATNNEQSSSTLKLACLYNIKLVRMHIKDKEKTEKPKGGILTIETSQKDSLAE